ncbi:MAG: hypothetical protein PVH46_10690 [Granulosicoccaceae bacterium]|jgi:hypothetical protein
MKTFAWGIGCLLSLVVLLYVLLLAQIGIADIVYAMLSGAIVGIATSLVGYAKGLSPHGAVSIVFASIMGAAASWLIALLLVKLTKVNLLGITALAFDLLIGIVGAATVAYLLLQFLIDRKVQQ